MPVPKIPLPGTPRIKPGEGVAAPRYLLGEIEELKAIAQAAGLGTLAYQLQCAAIEARAQVRQADERQDGTS